MYIYILVHKIKIAANILMGFKIWCQIGGGVTPFSKLPYSREFSNIWLQKSTDIRYKRSLWTIFWKFEKPSSIWVLVGGVLIFDQAPTMSLRGPAHQALRRARSASSTLSRQYRCNIWIWEYILICTADNEKSDDIMTKKYKKGAIIWPKNYSFLMFWVFFFNKKKPFSSKFSY